jgi:ferredoxin-nitrite reductase
MFALANIAETCGTGEVRLTVWQNLIIPNIPAAKLEATKAAILAAGLAFEAGTVLSGTVACTGNKGCRFAATDTKTHAVALANLLDSRFNIMQPVNLHVTGCSDSDQAIGRELIPTIKFRDLPPVMEQLFHSYTTQRNPEESFLDFTRRHTITELQSFYATQELV